MPSFYPVSTTRTANLLAQSRVMTQLHADQLDLQRLQNSISTGRRIERPGEDAVAAQRGQIIQRLLELKAQAKTNTQTAQSYLDATDAALAQVAGLLNDVRSAALTAASDTSTDAMRQAAVEQVEAVTTQLLNTGNLEFRGRYLFAGSRSASTPFTQSIAGVVYSG